MANLTSSVTAMGVARKLHESVTTTPRDPTTPGTLVKVWAERSLLPRVIVYNNCKKTSHVV